MKNLFYKIFSKIKNKNLNIINQNNITKISTKKDDENIKYLSEDFTICNICKNKSYHKLNSKILSKYDIKYYYCPNCSHLQTEAPYWIKEAYKNPISLTDIGILTRNDIVTQYCSCIIDRFFDNKAKFLDYAGGYGILVRKMRDIGFDFYWNDKYTNNIFAKGFEYKENNKKIELVTAIESFEHFQNPLEEIENLFKITDNILFTQEILPEPIPETKNWWYYSPETGQHISFYTNKTLDYIAKIFHKKHLYYGFIHLFTNKNISQKSFNECCSNIEKDFNNIKIKLHTKLYEDVEKIKKDF